MPTAGYEAATVNDRIYVVGSSFTYEYNPATDSWVAKRPKPTSTGYFTVTACENKIYAIGENNEVYDPATDTWEDKTPMSTARADGIEASAVNGKIYVITRYSNPTLTTSANLVYEPATDSWTTKTPMPYPTTDYVCAVVDSRIYVIGGYDNLNWDLNQIYNTETDTWSQGAHIPVPTWQAGAGVTTGNMAPKRIYVIDGLGSGMLDFLSRNYVYDPQTDAWSVGAELPTPRSHPAVAVVNDLLYAIGGVVGWGLGTSAVEQYTPFGYGLVPSVSSPENDKAYNMTSVPLSFSVSKTTAWMGYSLDGENNVTITGNVTLSGLSYGSHHVTVYAKDTAGITGVSETIYFSITEPFPTTWIAAAVVIAAVAGASLIVYFKKYRR